MYTRAVFLAGSLLLSASTTSAFAADIYAPSAGGYKDPIIKDQVIIPEAAAFQEYAEWYIRGDVGFGLHSGIDAFGDAEGTGFAVNGLDFDNFFSGSIGFGRYITPNVRLGIDLDYRHNTNSTYSTGNPTNVLELTNLGTIPLELTTTSVMFNAIYDFAPLRRFSPYVGGGLGVAFHNLRFNGTTYTNDVAPADGILETGVVSARSTSSTSFAANLMTGVSVNIRKGLFLDVGYKFSYLGDADVDFNVTHTGPATPFASTIDLTDIITHEFRVGVRYDLY